MMRNASCLVDLVHAYNLVTVSQRGKYAKPLFVQQSLPDLTIIISYFAYKCTQNGSFNDKRSHMVWNMIFYGQSLHPFRADPFYNQPFWVHKSIILLPIQRTNSGHSPFVVYLPLPISKLSISIVFELLLRMDIGEKNYNSQVQINKGRCA